jgi:hypothetical protein
MGGARLEAFGKLRPGWSPALQANRGLQKSASVC